MGRAELGRRELESIISVRLLDPDCATDRDMENGAELSPESWEFMVEHKCTMFLTCMRASEEVAKTLACGGIAVPQQRLLVASGCSLTSATSPANQFVGVDTAEDETTCEWL